MAEIAAAIAKHGNVWTLHTNREMEALYEPLHALQSDKFKENVRFEKGLKYGPNERNRIDLYYPATVSTSLLPVIVFFHGGGFVAGDNDITPSMHGHIGNYFASNGCVCALATYRLVPEAKYPSGAEDVSMTLKWVKDNIKNYRGNPAEMTAIGQSAGAAHLASAVFTGSLKRSDLALRGIVLLSAPLWYDLRQERRKTNMVSYHCTESEEEILAKTGVATFKSAKADDLPSKILLTLGEFDPNEIVHGNLMFVDEYRKRFNKLPILEVLKSHNHISYLYALGLEGDKLGKRILDFVAEK